jgi:hypothetical protein
VGLRRRHADVDLFGVGARPAQQPRRDQMIVQNDVSRFEVLEAANGHEPGIAGAGAD